MKNRVSRRKFLAVSTTTAAAAVAGAAVVGGVAGFFEGQSFAPTREITYTNTITQTRTVTAQPEKLKAGYIYVGPIGDYGWSYAHDVGRKKADAKTPNVESVYIESVPEAEAAGAIDTLIAQGAKLIAATSFGYMDALAEAAEKHPDLYFLHTGSGFRSGAAGNAPQNMSVIYAEEYQVYYLNGMAAGAVTNTGKLCFVAPFPIPVVWRNLNAFALGANYAYKKRTGRDIEVYAIWIYTWYDPGKTRTAVISLIEETGTDVVHTYEDSPTTLQVAEEYTTRKGKRVWAFSLHSDMVEYGPNSHLTGYINDWGPIYQEIYRMVLTGTWESVDRRVRIGDYVPYRWKRPVEKSTYGLSEGAIYPMRLNSVVPNEWQAEIKRRYEEMKELLFEPFSPEANLNQPIRDVDGNVRIDGKEVPRASMDMLLSMDWQVEYVKTPKPS